MGNRSDMDMRWGQAKASGRWPDMCFLSTWPGPTSETANCNLKTILFEPLFHPNLLTPPHNRAPSHRIRVDAPDVCLWNAHTGFKALGRKENKVRVQRGRALLVAQTVKNPPAMWETWVQSLDREDPLEEGVATHSSILAWRIPWTEEPGRAHSMGSQRFGHN